MLPRWLRTNRRTSTQTSPDEEGVQLIAKEGYKDEARESLDHENGHLHSSTSKRWSLWLTVAVQYLRPLKPRLFSKPKERRLHDTSFLDGLRGVAALIVVFYHGTLPFYDNIRKGYMSSESATNVLSAPIIRIWVSGPAMVDIFFVISGYVLSAKALRLIHEKQVAKAYETVSSSLFRRGPRIYIPCLVSTFVSGIFQQMDLLNYEEFRPYPPADSWAEQFDRWWHSTMDFITPFADGPHEFEQNTWTIPVEFKGSLLVFLCCMGLAGSTSLFRFSFLVLIAIFFLWHQWSNLFLFAAGMVCANVAIISPAWRSRSNNSSPESADAASTGDIPFHVDSRTQHQDATVDPSAPAAPSSELEDCPTSDTTLPPQLSKLIRFRQPLLTFMKHALNLFLFILPIYLLSQPTPWDSPGDTPGYMTLYNILTPENWRSSGSLTGQFWPNIGGVLLVLFLDYAGPRSIYQRIFRSRFAQYLGDISFSLYLIHAMILYGFTSPVIRGMCGAVGCGADDIGGEGWGRGVVMLLATVVTVPILAWSSEVFTTLVDDNAIRWSKKMMSW